MSSHHLPFEPSYLNIIFIVILTISSSAPGHSTLYLYHYEYLTLVLSHLFRLVRCAAPRPTYPEVRVLFGTFRPSGTASQPPYLTPQVASNPLYIDCDRIHPPKIVYDCPALTTLQIRSYLLRPTMHPSVLSTVLHC